MNEDWSAEAPSNGAFAQDTLGQMGKPVDDGLLRIAAATPQIRVGDVWGNARAILACVRKAERGTCACWCCQNSA